MKREERAPALYRRFLAGRPLLDEHGAEVPSAYMNCRNELAALLDALDRCERLAEEWGRNEFIRHSGSDQSMRLCASALRRALGVGTP